MCSNYRPVTRTDRLLTFFGVERERDDPPPQDVFPSGLAPMILLAPNDGATPRRLVALQEAIFRFVPDFIAKVEWARRTYNARAETVATRSAFRAAWAKGQRCIIPAECIYEANYETGKAVRWAIRQAGDVPLGIAGIYEVWTTPEGDHRFGMAMLTVNADDHPFMRRFHRPEDEKRMVAVLSPSDYAAWLACPVTEAQAFLRPWHGPLEGEPAPLPPRSKARTVEPPPPASGDLFG